MLHPKPPGRFVDDVMAAILLFHHYAQLQTYFLFKYFQITYKDCLGPLLDCEKKIVTFVQNGGSIFEKSTICRQKHQMI